MAGMNQYSFDSGPVFNGGSSNKKYLDGATSHKALTVDEAISVVNRVFDKIGSLGAEISNLERQVKELSDNWNYCINMDGRNVCYVDTDGINGTISTLQGVVDGGRSACIGILDGYNSTISEINTFLQDLENNASDLAEMKRNMENCRINMNDDYFSESESQNYAQQYHSLSNTISSYVEISSVEDIGKWVEN